MLSDHLCTECAHLLLAHNAPVKVKNAQGWSPLAEAISYGDRQMSKRPWMGLSCLLSHQKQTLEMPPSLLHTGMISVLYWNQSRFEEQGSCDQQMQQLFVHIPHCCLQADKMMLACLLCPSKRRDIPQGSLAFMLQWKAIHYPFLFFLSPCFTHFLRKDPSSLYFE